MKPPCFFFHGRVINVPVSEDMFTAFPVALIHSAFSCHCWPLDPFQGRTISLSTSHCKAALLLYSAIENEIYTETTAEDYIFSCSTSTAKMVVIKSISKTFSKTSIITLSLRFLQKYINFLLTIKTNVVIFKS